MTKFKDNKELKCFTWSCLRVIVVIAITTFLVSECNRICKDKNFIDDTIEQVHSAVNHVDSVWNDTTDKK